jgi:Uma2 family endonuclease
MAVEPATHRFTVDEYYRMVEVGILDPHSRVELIEGVITDMPPIGPEHAGGLNRGGYAFREFHEVATVTSQVPLRIDDRNEPIPDFMLLRRRDDFYRSAHPTPTDVLLVVEVSDTSLRTDRGIKASMYARAGIEEYWVVDLANRRLHRYRDPSESGYRLVSTHRAGEMLASLAFPDRPISVAELL